MGSERAPGEASPPVIRPLRGDDADLLEAFFASLGPQSRWWFHPHAFDRPTAERIVQRASDPGHLYVLAVRESAGSTEAVGYAYLTALNTDKPSLGIAVADHAQGQGIGQLLMKHLIGAARERGKSAISLTVYDDNPRARHVYEKLGFVTRRLSHHMELSLKGE